MCYSVCRIFLLDWLCVVATPFHAASMDQIFVEKDGQQLGPFSKADVLHNVSIGTLDPNDTAWRSGENVRGPLKDIVKLDATGSESTTNADYAPTIKITIFAVIISAVIIAFGGWMKWLLIVSLLFCAIAALWAVMALCVPQNREVKSVAIIALPVLIFLMIQTWHQLSPPKTNPFEAKFGPLGQTEDACGKAYGEGKVLGYDAPSEDKLVSYGAGWSGRIMIHFLKNVVTHIEYSSTMSDEKIAELLELNSQGHKWALLSILGNDKKWRRDDGATATYSTGLGTRLTISAKDSILTKR
jgi:hypothetical protein